MFRGFGDRRWTAFAVAFICAALIASVAVEAAGAARLVGKDGTVYACYRAKGKAKGAVRLVRKKQRCPRGQKKISWNTVGQAGSPGESGSAAEPGVGEPGAAGLESRVDTLLTRVETLEGKLKGITNLELTGVLAKLQGISPTQLQQAVAAVADVNALCTQATVLTKQLNGVAGALGGLSLNSVLTTLGGVLNIPAVPAALPAFGCP